LTEYGEKLDAAEKREIEAAIRDLEDALKRSDREEIQARIGALATMSQKLGEWIYKDNPSQGSGSAETAGQHESHRANRDEDVIDADFKEVNRKR
jgi:molecular chaperone DnaK